MLEFLKISEIIISILLIIVILIQNKSITLDLSSMGWWWMAKTTKRGAEKVLHNLTIFLWILFIVNSLLFFLYK